jgi:single-stranded DNA-binding protein
MNHPNDDCNVVMLAGRLCAPPEHRVTEGGNHLLRLLVAVRTDRPSRRLDVLPVIWWDPPPAVINSPPPSGTRVSLTAAVQRRFHQTSTGRTGSVEIVAGEVAIGEPATTADQPP